MIYINEPKYIKPILSPCIQNNWIMSPGETRWAGLSNGGGNAALIANGQPRLFGLWFSFLFLGSNLIREIFIIFISPLKKMISLSLMRRRYLKKDTIHRLDFPHRQFIWKWLLKDYISQQRKGVKMAFRPYSQCLFQLRLKRVALAIVQSQFLLDFPPKHCPRHHTVLFFIGLELHPSAVLAALRRLLDCRRVPRWPGKLPIPVGLLGHMRTSWDQLSPALCSGNLRGALTSHTSPSLTSLVLCDTHWSAVVGPQCPGWFNTSSWKIWWGKSYPSPTRGKKCLDF